MSRRFLVVIDCANAARATEALRAAIGIGLRGDHVAVFLLRTPPKSPSVERALATLRKLGHEVVTGGIAALVTPLRVADAVEVWR
jgi:hypothetical protein